MAASAILNLYLAILNHPRSSLMAMKSHRKYGVNRTFTFQDIMILQFWKLRLKRLFRPQNLRFLGRGLTPKWYFSLLRPPKGTSLAENTRFEPSLHGRRMTRGATGTLSEEYKNKTRKPSCRTQIRATLAKSLHGLRKSSMVVSCIAIACLSIACLYGVLFRAGLRHRPTIGHGLGPRGFRGPALSKVRTRKLC